VYHVPIWSYMVTLHAIIKTALLVLAICQSSNPAPPPGASSRPADSHHGVIVVPLENDLGLTVPPRVLDTVLQKADEMGPGQTMLLVADTDNPTGQRVIEWIANCRKQHRVVMWIKRPSVRAFCWGMYCDDRVASRDCIAQMLSRFPAHRYLPDTVESRDLWMNALSTPGNDPPTSSRQLADQCLSAAAIRSYDIDPTTSEVLIRDDLRGEFIFSPKVGCTPEQAIDLLVRLHVIGAVINEPLELANWLGGDEWQESSDAGRKAMRQWEVVAKKCEPLILSLVKQWRTAPAADRPRLLRSAIEMWQRCPELAGVYLPPREMLEDSLRDYGVTADPIG
jgi:hypothetical protein